MATCRRRNLRILACGGTRITAVFAAEGDVLFGRKKYRSQSATGVVCRFWSAVNRGLRPRGTLYILTAKSTKNSPADAFAYFVPSNVRNGRLFAGLQANRPRFLPLLAGTSFRGSGIGPGLFAAERGRKLAQQQDRKRSILPSPLKAVLNRRIIAWSGIRTTDSPRARSGRLHSLVLAAPAQRGPEVVPAKATCGWFWRYLLPPKGSYTPRHSPRFCLFDRRLTAVSARGR